MSGEQEARREDVRMQWDVRIPLRDGAQLSAILYLPSRTPAPALFTLTPYTAQTHHDQGIYFASRGYAFLSVDVRGRGNSDGTFKPIEHEAHDGYDIVEWLARQPYCNAKVAMWGGSYMGYAQWATAKELPPHLATITPVAAPFRGGDSPLRNNIFVPYSVQWLAFLAGRTLQDKIIADQSCWSRIFRRWFEAGLPLRELDGFAGCPSAVFQEWLSHPHRGEYWDRYNPSPAQYAALTLPVLTITGAYDANQVGALMHYREHERHGSAAARARHYVVIGPWDHAGTRIPKANFCGIEVGPASLIDIADLHAQWYAWTMRGGPKPAFLQRNVAYYVMGTEKWRYADSLAAITARSMPLYLDSSCNPVDVSRPGSLASAPPAVSDSDHYIYDPRDVSRAALESTVDPENRVDQRMILACAGKHLVYDSAPFEVDTEVSGFFRLCMWIALDQPDTDFRASIYEVAPDGRTLQLTSDSLRARYRESFRTPKLVRTGEALRYDFENFPFVSRRIGAGIRLRLVLGPINSIFTEKNYNSGGVVCEESVQQARTVNVRLFHDESHPSALHVPLGQSED